MASVEQREVLRCEHCSLVQFRTTSAMCRRCRKSLEVEVPEPAPTPLALVPPQAEQEGGLQVATGSPRSSPRSQPVSAPVGWTHERSPAPTSPRSRTEKPCRPSRPWRASPKLCRSSSLLCSATHLRATATRHGPHDRSLPRPDRSLHLAAGRSAALRLPQPRSRASRRPSPHRLVPS